MALPDLIEIVAPQTPAPVLVTIPGSKSITNRALILASLADGETTLRGALWSDDTEIMVEALRALGFDVSVEPDLAEAGNCTLRVVGHGGAIPSGDRAIDIYVGNAGTAARFLMALLCLGRGVYRVHGTTRMHQRPQGALLTALRSLGYRVDADGDGLPATIHGGGPRAGACSVSIEESSQFASALLLSSRVGGWRVSVEGEDAEESAYVAMTLKLLEVFPEHGGEFQVEPDCSSASYFLAASTLLAPPPGQSGNRAIGQDEDEFPVAAWPESDWQIDGRFVEFLRRFEDEAPEVAYPALSRAHDLGDAIMTAITLAPLLLQPSRFVDLGRLRLQECERVRALRVELTKCGARVVEAGDTLEGFPSELHGAEIETYDDHRMAMCFSTLGLRVPGLRIRNPACVAKTFPNFYAKLAEAPPDGLGARVLDASTGSALSGADLLPAS